MTIQEYQSDGYTISTDPARLDVDRIQVMLNKHSYWAQTRTLDTVRRAVANSLNFGIYYDNEQVGFARLVTDYVTFAWLCDVIILPEHRGNGLGKWLVACILEHPDIQNIRRILLATRDAHGLYRKYGGFEILQEADRWMVKMNPEPG